MTFSVFKGGSCFPLSSRSHSHPLHGANSHYPKDSSRHLPESMPTIQNEEKLLPENTVSQVSDEDYIP